MAPAPPLRVLSLDGGGIRGKSSLLILEKIMETIRQTKNLESVPKPCEYFDLIGGTSTGGIIAIMLGRLGMTVDECIRAYDKVAQTAFTPKRTLSLLPASPKGAYSAQALEGAIKQTVREFCVEPTCIDQRRQGRPTVETCPHADAEFRNASCTKTVVLAITKDNVDAGPTLFTTYDTSASYQGCAIWQVARATSAATTFFKSIKVGRDNVEFIDAGFGHNNPCEVLIEEAQRQFPRHSTIQALSIGTGLGAVVDIKDSRRAILKALAKMASTSTAVATRLDNRYKDSGQYYRFNVDRGLQDITLSDWEKMSTISAHTGNYLRDNQRVIQRFVDGLIDSNMLDQTRQRPEATDPDDTTASSSARCYIPLQTNKHFVGRRETLELLRQQLFAQGGRRRVCLHGLGGIGKTQVALQIAYEAKDRQGLLVIWLLAANGTVFRQACAEALKHLGIQVAGDEDPEEVLQRHLNSDRAGKWLLIIDNLDEMGTLRGSSDQPGGIHRFLPDSDSGRILFTTRSYDIGKQAADDTVELKKMSPEEAMLYLEKKAQLEDQDDAAAAELLVQLGHIPLAITQAAAYLERNRISVRKYVDLLRETESNTVQLMTWEFPDKSRYDKDQYGLHNAVALTWQVSFKQISDADAAAAQLLRFISRIEPKAIPRTMLPVAESEIQLTETIGTLIGYAFLDDREGGDAYDMHSLVHLATRTWVKAEGYEKTAIADAVAHLSEVFPTDDWENRHVWRQYLPHALRALQEDGIRLGDGTDLGYWVGSCLNTDGQQRDAVRILERVTSVYNTALAEDHPRRLASQHEVALAYQKNGQVVEAVKLLEHVVSIRQALAEDHPDRLASQHVLAMAYQENGQVVEAIKLLEHVVSIEQALAEDHPSRLASQHELASAYQENGQVLEAVKLLENVVSIRQALAEDHPDRLASQHVLAVAYQRNGQVLEAVKLLEHIVSIEQALAEDHPSRLASQHALAMAYQANGQVLEAVELLEHVVAIRKVALAESHPFRLASQHDLAIAYQENKQVLEAIKLLEHVVAIQKVTIAEGHPDRLASQHALAGAYQANGQVLEAVKLLEHVVAIRKVTLAEGHPSRLASQHNLALAYQENGQVLEAVKLLEHVVAIQKLTLAKDHPHRLGSERALEMVYEELNSGTQAEA
ncbi:hypothetical protein F5X98DRAFT_379817 [Xylaria grammica]|nr:hypothetical protein F5X98DRAFT_379817 [Xylaria grammica]